MSKRGRGEGGREGGEESAKLNIVISFVSLFPFFSFSAVIVIADTDEVLSLHITHR